MFIDLMDANLQPMAISEGIPEIVLSDSLREKLQAVFEEEDRYARIYSSTSVVKPDNNYVFFSNHWFYLGCLQYPYHKPRQHP